jgi:hypothetical protein
LGGLLKFKGQAIRETLAPNLEVYKVNEKTIEEMKLQLSPNPKVDKDGSTMVFRENGFPYEKTHLY